MTSIPRNHSLDVEPPEKYKPSRERGQRHRRKRGNYYTDEYKDWFANQTKDIDSWKEFTLFCRKHEVDSTNSHQWRKQRYPELWPRGKAKTSTQQPYTGKKRGRKSNDELRAMLVEEQEKVAALTKQFLSTDGSAAMKLAEELEVEKTKLKTALELQKEAETQLRNKIQDLNQELKKAGAGQIKLQRERSAKLDKELQSLQSKYNDLVEQLTEADKKVKHHNDILTSLNTAKKDLEAAHEELARFRKLGDGLSDSAEDTLAGQKKVVEELQQELQTVTASRDLALRNVESLTESVRRHEDAQRNAEPSEVDGVTISTIFWAGALSTGTMPDPIQAGAEIRRLLERIAAGDL